MAKTHLSLSSDATLRGAPTGWRLPVREVRASVGAGLIYPICGAMQTMPGLGSHPAAAHIDIDDRGEIVGLFEAGPTGAQDAGADCRSQSCGGDRRGGA